MRTHRLCTLKIQMSLSLVGWTKTVCHVLMSVYSIVSATQNHSLLLEIDGRWTINELPYIAHVLLIFCVRWGSSTHFFPTTSRREQLLPSKLQLLSLILERMENEWQCCGWYEVRSEAEPLLCSCFLPERADCTASVCRPRLKLFH